MNKVSLKHAFLVRYISEGPTRKRCHVTAIDIIGRRTPNLDPEVFCCKIWSKIVSYLNKHEIWPKYGILSQWWLHAKLTKTSIYVLALLSHSWRYPVCDFLGWSIEWKLVSNPIIWLYQFWLFTVSITYSRNYCAQEYSHTFYRVTPNMCIIYVMGNYCFCWLLTSLGTGCHKWLNCLCAGIELGHRTAPSDVFSQPYGKKK